MLPPQFILTMMFFKLVKEFQKLGYSVIKLDSEIYQKKPNLVTLVKTVNSIT